MKKILLVLLVAVLSVQMGMAQEAELKDSPIDFSVNLQSNHLWRGLVITDKPVIMVFTSLKLNESGSFTTGFWGGMSFSNESDGTSYKEINYFVQYAKNGFSIGLWDLFNTRGVASPDVWDYDKETSGHLLDLRTSYNFGESFPLTLEADFLLFGSGDGQYNTNGDFEQRTSSYVQISYPLIKGSKVNLDAFVGAGFSLNGDTHLYGDGQENFDIVNVGLTTSKILKVADLSIPVSATTLWNPSTKIARVQLAVTLF
ncbi:hypothetical protein [Lutibacter sp.]|uniref:hypothetical protein n=1 Tax=Lutibacter sp. TaxID=1925666 RepID=UPI003566FD43